MVVRLSGTGAALLLVLLQLLSVPALAADGVPRPGLVPHFNIEPVPQMALVGQTVRFFSAASSSAPVFYQWYQDGMALTGATNATLTLPSVQTNQTGIYSVEASTPFAKQSSHGARLLISSLAKEGWVAKQPGAVAYPNAAHAVALDADGNVYAAGHLYQSPVTGVDCATVKFSPSGSRLWVRTYDGGSQGVGDYAQALTVGGSGIYVVGLSSSSNDAEDYLTIKYDRLGELLWSARYSPSPFSKASAYGVTLDSSENVFVWGNFGTVKYDGNGQRLASEEDSRLGQVAGAVVDLHDNLHVLRLGYLVTKYASNGQRLWETEPASNRDWSSSLAVDRSGQIYVTGLAGTKKFGPTGKEIWHNPNVSGWSIVLDQSDQPIVAGTEAILKLDTDGGEIWRHAIAATSLVIGKTDAIYFSAATPIAHMKFLQTTGKLEARGSLVWGALFGDPADIVSGLAVSPDGVLHLAGSVGGDLAVAAYLPNPSPTAPSIVTPPESQMVKPGTFVQLDVSAEGEPPLVYQWLFDGMDLPGATNKTLGLPNFQPAQAGDYTVVVKNGQGWAVSPVTRLGLTNTPLQLGKPEFTLLLESALDIVPTSNPSQLPRVPIYGQAGGTFILERSRNLKEWSAVGVFPNPIGVTKVLDPLGFEMPLFYRAKAQ